MNRYAFVPFLNLVLLSDLDSVQEIKCLGTFVRFCTREKLNGSRLSYPKRLGVRAQLFSPMHSLSLLPIDITLETWKSHGFVLDEIFLITLQILCMDGQSYRLTKITSGFLEKQHMSSYNCKISQFTFIKQVSLKKRKSI